MLKGTGKKNSLIEMHVLYITSLSTEYHLTEYGKSMNQIVYEKDKVYSDETRASLKNTFKETLKIDD